MKIQDYLSQVEHSVVFYPVSSETWETIVLEGLPDEQDALERKMWWEGEIKLSEEDRANLMSLDSTTIDKFNQFDIELKNTYNCKITDLIDYQNGKILLVKART